MKVSLITTVTVRVTDIGLNLAGLPNKFIGCFTGVPTREKLREAIFYKAEFHKIPETALENILKVVDELQLSTLDHEIVTESGSVKVFTMEPLFKP